MRKFYFLVLLLLFILTSCENKITEEYLIGGEWVAIAGYKDGEVKGDPNCDPFEKGNEFKSEDTVYNRTYGEDVRYEIIDDGFEIVFIFKNIGTYRYQIKMISNNELVLEGIGVGSEGHSCYMERK